MPNLYLIIQEILKNLQFYVSYDYLTNRLIYFSHFKILKLMRPHSVLPHVMLTAVLFLIFPMVVV